MNDRIGDSSANPEIGQPQVDRQPAELRDAQQRPGQEREASNQIEVVAPVHVSEDVAMEMRLDCDREPGEDGGEPPPRGRRSLR